MVHQMQKTDKNMHSCAAEDGDWGSGTECGDIEWDGENNGGLCHTEDSPHCDPRDADWLNYELKIVDWILACSMFIVVVVIVTE